MHVVFKKYFDSCREGKLFRNEWISQVSSTKQNFISLAAFTHICVFKSLLTAMVSSEKTQCSAENPSINVVGY